MQYENTYQCCDIFNAVVGEEGVKELNVITLNPDAIKNKNTFSLKGWRGLVVVASRSRIWIDLVNVLVCIQFYLKKNLEPIIKMWQRISVVIKIKN